jgi:Fe-S oxidoreductase
MRVELDEAERLAAIRSCRYCPMCHHADIVTTLERRETWSARGRGLTLFAIEQGKAQWDADTAEVMYRFFADGLCQQVCAGHIPHDELVVDARHRLVASGRAPAVVLQVRRNIEARGNPWGESEPDLRGLPGARDRAEVLLYFGSTARVRRPGVVTGLAKAFRTAGMDFTVLADEGDPGLLLYELGESEAAAAAASALTGKIAGSGARTLVTPDAETYRALKSGFGPVAALTGVAVRHSSELLAELARELKWRAPRGRRVAYHDPCALARWTPCLDAPRTLLRSVLGTEPLEIGVWSRQLANCSGECGGVPFTHPELARKAAARRIQEAREAGADLVVAGSPAAAAALEGHGLAVRETGELVAEALS